MAYSSYLLERFNTTHENIFFRKIDEELRNIFQNQEGEHILIGNIRVQGNALDAIFIKAGAIIIIDFKDYEGRVTFSENGPWKLKTKENNTVFVAGGALARNPFQQVNAYRFGLMEFINANEDQIVEPNHTNINWSHIATMVLFQRKIAYNQEEIPSKLQRYFHITDNINFINRLNDIHSDSLVLSNQEISRLLERLNITLDQIYNPSETKDEVEKKDDVKFNPDVIARIDKILENTPRATKSQKVLSFYNTMISIERLKEISLSNTSTVPYQWNEILPTGISLDLTYYTPFYDVFKNEKFENFPRALFIGVNAIVLDKSIPLFYQSVQQKDILDDREIKLNLETLELFVPELVKLNLPEDILEDISGKINDTKGLIKKLQELETILDLEIKLDDKITLGLSTESLYTAQLQSEINSILKGKVNSLNPDSVLNSVIEFKDNKFKKIKELKKFVPITNLNDSQLRAVESAFENSISVITGPPGTGKSQVVLNIIGNCIANNQKVIFASRNNKAVDNVYERFNSLLQTDYFLRFGDNRTNADLAQSIKKFKVPLNENDVTSTYENYNTLINQYSNAISLNKDKIRTIDRLERLLSNKEVEKEKAHEEFDRWKNNIDHQFYDWFIVKRLVLDISNSEMNGLLNMFSGTDSFIGKIMYNLFRKTKVLALAKSINEKLPKEINRFIDSNFPLISASKGVMASVPENIRAIINLKNNQEEISANHSRLVNNLELTEKSYKEIYDQYQFELLMKSTYENEIEVNNNKIKDIAVPYLKSVMKYKIHHSSGIAINEYSSYLVNGMPWKSDEIIRAMNTVSDFTDSFNAVSVSNLTVKKSFPLAEEFFDLLIIDEASQCDIVSVLPLIYRAKRVCVLGDPYQLKHITSINKVEQQYVLDKLNLPVDIYDYKHNSLYDVIDRVATINNIQPIFLDEHYRCHQEIIGFSKKYFYNKKAGQNLKVKSDASSYKVGDVGFNWVDVKGKVLPNKNCNLYEVEKCAILLEDLIKKYPEASFGVVTPFRYQKEELQRRIKSIPAISKNTNENKIDVVVDTVHRFQGDEKDIIILSLVVSNEGKPSLENFINFHSPYLLNVALTRAKSSLYVVGDKTYCSRLINNYGKTLLAHLADYDREIKGEVIVDEVKPKPKPKEKIKTITSDVLPDEIINDVVLNEIITPVNNDLINPATTYETIKALINEAIKTNSTIEIEYKNYNGEFSIRKLSEINYNQELSIDNHIKGYCHNRNEERTFRIDNISKVTLLN